MAKAVQSNEFKENITFRLEKALLDRVRFEADEKNSSVNSVAQSIIATHYKWTGVAAKAGMVPIHKTLLAMLIDKIDDDEIAKIAKLFADIRVKDMTLILRNNYGLAAFLDVLETWMTMSSVSFTKSMVDSSYHYIISHDIGAKWSSFLSLMLSNTLKNMGVQNLSLDVTESTVMFSIPKVVLRSK
jgi:hypothetical protein